MGNTLWFAELCIGLSGCGRAVLIDAATESEAQAEAYLLCAGLAEEYGFEQNLEHFGDYDSVGKDFDEDSGEYEEEGQLSCHVTEYVPELHDDYL